jgi:hypothetical protein
VTPGRDDSPPVSARQHPYQDALRTIGDWLDRSEWDTFTIFEVRDGFSVVLEGSDDRLQEFDFTLDELLWNPKSAKPASTSRGSKGKGRISRTSPSASLTRSGYSDFLRALGFELDVAEAHSMILTKVGDTYLLSYAYIDAAQGYNGRKRRIVIDADGIEEIMGVARSRRRDAGALRALQGVFKRR